MKLTTAKRLVEVLMPRVYGAFGDKRLVLAHGVFDLVHPGHIRHLRWAAAQADILVVSITADRFVNKGADRPWFPELQRAEVVAALEMVDHVIINDAPDASPVILALRPHVFVKGRDYLHSRLAEDAALNEVGAKVLYSPGDIVHSSTALGKAAGL